VTDASELDRRANASSISSGHVARKWHKRLDSAMNQVG
jgi:hypothetical protein